MSKRLEEIAYNVGISLDGEKALMSSDDYDFLYNYALEQAERAQELEESEQNMKYNIKHVIDKNKRYREVLERISKHDAYEIDIFVAGKMADRALEGDPHESI